MKRTIQIIVTLICTVIGFIVGIFAGMKYLQVFVMKKLDKDFEQVILENRADAEEILKQMNDIIEKYGYASVMDLYDLLNIQPKYLDSKYGWKDLTNTKVILTKQGYTLDLPKTISIK